MAVRLRTPTSMLMRPVASGPTFGSGRARVPSSSWRSSPPHSPWLGSFRCCFGHSSILMWRTIRSTSWSSGSWALSRSASATRQVRRPTGAGMLAYYSSRSRSWRPAASCGSTLSGRPASSSAEEHAGFQVAIPVGLLVSAIFAVGSAFVDVRPGIAAVLIRRRTLLRLVVLVAMGVWFVWTVANLPPLGGPDSEAATNRLLIVIAVLGTIMYAVSAARYWSIFRHSRNLLPAAVVACFVLLSEAMIGVAVTGERKWHASWWEWHGLIVTAYLIVGLAARREWRDERFRRLYLPTTRERHQDVSVLFADLVGFTGFAERSSPAAGCSRARRVLGHRSAADHTSVRRRGREVHRRRRHGHVQQQRRPARSRATSIVRRSGTATQGCPPGRATSRLASHARWRQQRRR